MNPATKEKVLAQLANWQYLQQLPPDWQGFKGRRLMAETGDVLDICCYELPELHRSATLYYHEETQEYKVRLQIGILEFCAIEYIQGTLNGFEAMLASRFALTLQELAQPDPAKVSSILYEKKILQWDYHELLLPSCAGFELFIAPDRPVRTINGSYIILDYSDFAAHSNFAVYYNIFRDEFFGESRLHDIPEVSYEFDATELDELVEKLREKLPAQLQLLCQRLAPTKKPAP